MYQTSLTKGQELTAQRMVRELRTQGHEAFLITSAYHDGEPVISEEKINKKGGYVQLYDETLGIPVIRVQSSLATWPPRRIAFDDFMAVLTDMVDELKLNVLITHSTLWNGPEEVTKFIEWRRRLAKGGAPLSEVIFCHMSHFQEPSDERYAIVERSYRQTWNDVSLSRIVADADLILVTTSQEDEIMKKFGGSGKAFLFPGGIDDIQDGAGDPSFLDRLKIPSGTKIIGVLGTVEERKNTLTVLEIAKRLAGSPNVRFVIAGGIEGEYGEKVKQESQSLENVVVAGPISEAEKVTLIRASYLNLIMSRSEALGISQLEFMSAGVPVLSSGVGGQSWLLRDGVNGFLLDGPDDVDGAAQKISMLVEDPSMRRKIGRNALIFASSFLMSRLINRLARKLESMEERLSGQVAHPTGMPQELTLEAWTSRRQSVAATNKRLIIRAIEKGGNVITIPYDQIQRVTHSVKLGWKALFVGSAASLLLLFIDVTRFPPVLDLAGRLNSFLSPYVAIPLWFFNVVPFLPLTIATIYAILTLNRGYLVHVAEKDAVFVSGEFLKALRFANRLTPHDIFRKKRKKT